MIRGFRVETILTYSQTLNRQTAPLSLTRRHETRRDNKSTGRGRGGDGEREQGERARERESANGAGRERERESGEEGFPCLL